jgi:mRNA interferase HigB
MRILGVGILHDFKLKHADSCGAINSWLKEVKNEKWSDFHDIRRKYASASNLGDRMVIFNIKGNRYRLKIKVDYRKELVLVKAIGTHAEYSKW